MHHRRINHRHSAAAVDPPPPDLQPGSSSSLRRHVASSLMQYHRSNLHRAIQPAPLSPASYGSSMEIMPCKPAITPTTSIDPKSTTNCGIRTSTELLKVLNRIWTLEEQHVSNTSLIKSLKKELNNSRSQVKVLLKEQQANRQQMEELTKHITETNFHLKHKEQDRINSTIQSIRDELESERKLRKRSESLHRKLARELHEVKTTLVDATKVLENERSSRSILESLCDEFALGIRGYEKDMHAYRQKSDKDWSERGNLILHVSESWLDQRTQMNLQSVGGEKKSVVEKLRPEIEAFLNAKNENCSVENNKNFRRSSLESIPFNTIVSGPNEEDGDGSTLGDYNCFKVEKVKESRKTENGETSKQSPHKKVGPERGHSPLRLQVKFEELMSEAMKNSRNVEDEANEPTEVVSERKHDSSGKCRVNSNYVIENLIRSHHYLLSENGNKEANTEYEDSSTVWRGQPSPVRKWTEKLPSHHELEIHKEKNSLKAKLLEGRIRGQRFHPHSKSSIIPSRK